MHGRRNNGGFLDSDEDEMGRGLLTRFIEGSVLFVIAAYLIRLGVWYLLSVKVPLVVIGSVIGLLIAAWRIHKWRKRDDY